MAKGIVFSKKAQIDIARITDFNNSRNKSDLYSKKVFSRLTKRLQLLLKNPLSGLESEIDGENSYLLIWDDYYIFYDFHENIIEITAIYHQKENVNR